MYLCVKQKNMYCSSLGSFEVT